MLLNDKKKLGIIAIIVVAVVLIISIVCAIVGHEKKREKDKTAGKGEQTEITQSVTEESQSYFGTEEVDSEQIATMTPIDTETEETEQHDPNDLTGETVEDSPYYITVNRTQNIVIIYTKDENGQYTVPYKAMICSVGKDGKTPVGEFTTSVKWRWAMLSGNVYAQYVYRFKNSYLFHSVPYLRTDVSTLESEEYNKLGEPASKGCVRLTVEDAKWLVDNVPSGTGVKIYDSDAPEPLPRPEAPKIDLTSPNKGWDPTDPNEKNPWFKTPPVFTRTDDEKNDKTIKIEAGSEFKIEDIVKASDFRGRAVSVEFSCDKVLNTFVEGTYTYTCKAKDSKGNEGTATYVVEIKDTLAPQVQISKEPFQLTLGLYEDASRLEEYMKANIVSTDNSGPDHIITSLNQADVDRVRANLATGKTGTDYVHFTVQDTAGNKAVLPVDYITVHYMEISMKANVSGYVLKLDEIQQKTGDEWKNIFMQHILAGVETKPGDLAITIEINNWDFAKLSSGQLQELRYTISYSKLSFLKPITGTVAIEYEKKEETTETPTEDSSEENSEDTTEVTEEESQTTTEQETGE